MVARHPKPGREVGFFNGKRTVASGDIYPFGIAGCSSAGSGAQPALQTPDAVSARRAAAGKLVLRIRIPRKHHRAHYVSPSTKGMTVSIVGLTDKNETVELTPTANGCTSSLAGTLCTLSVPGLKACPSSAACYSATIATYDAVSGCPLACAIPGAAKKLSGNQNVVFTIATGQSNLIGITLDGIATSVALVPDATSTMSGTMASGFCWPMQLADSAR